MRWFMQEVVIDSAACVGLLSRRYYRPHGAVNGDHIHTLRPPPDRSFNISTDVLLRADQCSLPGHRKDPHMSGANPPPVDEDAAVHKSPAQHRRQELLAALGATHLTVYMGKVVPGWYTRPKVGRRARACPQDTPRYTLLDVLLAVCPMALQASIRQPYLHNVMRGRPCCIGLPC